MRTVEDIMFMCNPVLHKYTCGDRKFEYYETSVIARPYPIKETTGEHDCHTCEGCQNYEEIRQLAITCSLEKTTHVPGDTRTDVRFRKETTGGDILAGHASLPCPSPEYAQASRQTGSAAFLTLCSRIKPSAYYLIFLSTLRMRQNPPRRH